MSKDINKVVIHKGIKNPTHKGVHHRLLCMTGKNKGVVYFLKGDRVVAGRGDGVDVHIDDSKASREHAEFKLTSEGKYVLTDLNSQNGVIVNDLKITQDVLANGDNIIIGQTVYKYNIITVDGHESINKETNRGLDISKLDFEKSTKIESDDESTADESINDGGAKKQQKKNGKLTVYLLLAITIIGGTYFFDTGKKNETKKMEISDQSAADDAYTEMLKKKQRVEDKEQENKVNTVIQRGQRELREGNYFRAMGEFNLALVLDPKNGQASYYLNKAKQALDQEIEVHFLNGKKSFEALKLKSAIVSYCNIVRLLEGYEEDARYIDAVKNLEMIEKKMGLDTGEIKCF